ncbi:MAG TPA: hypothetical protein VF009_06990 [Solirubrobacterales bacterium]
MSRRKRQRRRPAQPVDVFSVEKAELEPFGLELTFAEQHDDGAAKPLLAELIAAQKTGDTESAASLAQQIAQHGVYVGQAEEDEPDADDTPPLDFTPQPGVPQPDGDGQGVQEARPGAVQEYEPEPDDLPEWEEPPVEEQDELDFEPLQPPPANLSQAPVFPLGPLAAGIQMLDAMLEQAKGGYITERVEQLEGVLHEQFDAEERMLIADYASRFRDGMGLPDVSGAYEQLVARRAEQVGDDRPG